jgi:pyruvate/2-oxoglutarate dehydrogenase complex dihydrolipoamide dehydrogenase (E3) component
MSGAEQQAPEVREYDVVVLGAGSTGENVADRAGRGGLSVVVVEDELVGGECSYWACMPSKALLRPGAVLAAARAVPGAAAAVTGRLDVAGALARRNTFASHWDDHGQVEWLDGAGIALVRGRARFAGPRAVVVEDDMGLETVLRARHAVVVATGSEPALPDVDGLAGAAPWTSREATSAQEVPASLAILGGGVVAVEMAVAYTDLGAAVTVLVRGDRLLARAEPFAAREVADALVALGVDLRTGSAVTSVWRAADGVHVMLADGGEVVSEQLLVATGRAPRTADLGLEVFGLRPDAPLEVDDAMTVGAVAGGWLFAAGDVTGRTATTHQGKYDARVAGDVVAARFGTSEAARRAEASAGAWSRYRASADGVGAPQVVFSRPEVAWVGLTEHAARDAGLDVRVVQYDVSAVSGASVAADGYAGTAQLVLDDARGIVVGATFTGPDAAELVHAATVAVVGQVPLDRLWHAVPAYPTVSEVWLRLLETAGL